jgi:hypothetical protein
MTVSPVARSAAAVGAFSRNTVIVHGKDRAKLDALRFLAP